MKKWFSSKTVAIVMTVLLFLSVSMQVYGAGSLTEITAHLNSSIKLIVDGKPFNATHPGDGSKMEPITYKGFTYLPMRAVADAVGKKVTWDENTETAYLGEVSGQIGKKEINYIRATTDYTNQPSAFVTKDSGQELLTYGGGKVFDYGYAWERDFSSNVTVGVYTNFEYDKFKATAWLDISDTANDEAYVEVTDGNHVLIKKFKGTWGQPLDFEVDVKAYEQIIVTVKGDRSILGVPMLGK